MRVFCRAPAISIPGPGAGLVYVEWDGEGLVCAVSLRDLKLEPAEDERRR